MDQAPGIEKEEEERWAACFQGPNDEPYLLVKQFPGGCESSVKLLIHQHTSKLIVRKVPHVLGDRGKVIIDLVKAAHIDAFRDSNEIQMVKYLTPFHHHQPAAHIYELIASRNIEVDRNLVRGSGRLFLRESFWEHCNAGSLEDLAQLLCQGGLAHPPRALVARIIHHVLAGVHFMLSSGRGVRHRDLHLGNIFAHWGDNILLPEIVLADFGAAQFVVGKDDSVAAAAAADRAARRRTMRRDDDDEGGMMEPLLTDISMFATFLVNSWYVPASVARDPRFSALVGRLHRLRFVNVPAVMRDARRLEMACLEDDEVVACFELFAAHQAQRPCVAKIWPNRDVALRETRDLPGPFDLIRL